MSVELTAGTAAETVLNEVSRAKPDDLAGMFKSTWLFGVQMQWASALVLERVDREQLTQGRSVARWVLDFDLPGLKHKSTISRLLKAAKWLRQLPAPERTKWQALSPWDTYDVIELARVQGPDAAYEMATSERTPAQKRQAVRDSQTDQHYDSSGLRTYKRQVSGDTYDMLMSVENAARNHLGKAFPIDDDVLHLLAADYLSGFIPASVQSGEEAAPLVLMDVLAGRVRCIECGAWWPVQRHHAIPRRHAVQRPNGGGKWKPSDPQWPCVYLCTEHHQRVTENVDGTWRDHLRRWMGKSESLTSQVNDYLGRGRRLEDI